VTRERPVVVKLGTSLVAGPGGRLRRSLLEHRLGGAVLAVAEIDDLDGIARPPGLFGRG